MNYLLLKSSIFFQIHLLVNNFCSVIESSDLRIRFENDIRRINFHS
jgi:hypothetical protein